ncbi:MAG TPA: sialidase family protein, partial [Gemmatimonadaceae bacterium]
TGDPIVGFGATGTMFAHFTDQPLLRSADGGRTWTASTRKDQASTFWNGDRETFSVDMSGGRFRGRVYLITNDAGSDGKYNRVLLRSLDDGRTFEAAVGIDTKPDLPGTQSHYPYVLTDGTLIMPTGDRTPEFRGNAQINRWVVNLSTDGGTTFRRNGVFPEFHRTPPNANACPPTDRSVVVPSRQHFNADVSPRSLFHDRLYVAWLDCRGGAWRVFFSASSDRGATWSAPRPISPDVPASSAQFIVATAVSPTGVVGVQWYDTRNAEASDGYDLYFTASIDGGATFLPAVRVTSELSKPSATALSRKVVRARTRQEQGQDGPREFWASRGDLDETRGVGHYAGLAADAGGIFHPFWADARSGTTQVYTAQLRVVADPALAPAGPCGSAAGAERSLKNVVDLEFDPPRTDAATNELLLPVRLRNLSRDTVCGPFTVALARQDSKSMMEARQKGVPPQFKPSDVKEYRLSEALRDLAYLSPGATTEPVIWRLRFAGEPNARSSGLVSLYEVRGWLAGGK